MITTYKKYSFNLTEPLDISIPFHTGDNQVNCYYAPPFRTEPVVMGTFIGDTELGGVVNYKNVFINPHGSGTHTECVAHICNEKISIHKVLKQTHFLAQLISVESYAIENGDFILTKDLIENKIEQDIEAIILRTLPNKAEKISKNYSGTNPPYMDNSLANYLCEKNIHHLLIDLPSLDREQDEGKLLAHRAFFNYPDNIRYDATITELIYVPDIITDGIYLLDLQIAPFELDAAPSKPILYRTTTAEV